jgi:type VI secretion system protein ImpA
MDLETLLAPVSPDDQCGADLEYDASFSEIDRLSQGKPEQQIGTTIVPAEEPDWKNVQKKSTEFLAHSKDLRVAAHLTRALLRNNGWSGLATGLGLLRGLVERYWDGVHPRLDPTDDNDPTMRINVFSSFSDTPMLAAVRATPLISSRALGRFSLRDLEIAGGDMQAPAAAEGAAAPPTMATIDGAAMDVDLAGLDETAKSLHACVESLKGLEDAIGARVDAAAAASFGKLPTLLRKADNYIAGKLAQRSGTSDAAGEDGAVETNGTHGTSAGPARAFGGAINTREDVVKALDAICAYYARNEPSSPIPMFMERSKRLVMMSFVDLIKELVPEGLSKVDMLRGQSEG